MPGFPRTPELEWFKISAFPAPLEEESLPYRHATFSISVESSPLALHAAFVASEAAPNSIRQLKRCVLAGRDDRPVVIASATQACGSMSLSLAVYAAPRTMPSIAVFPSIYRVDVGDSA